MQRTVRPQIGRIIRQVRKGQVEALHALIEKWRRGELYLYPAERNELGWAMLEAGLDPEVLR